MSSSNGDTVLPTAPPPHKIIYCHQLSELASGARDPNYPRAAGYADEKVITMGKSPELPGRRHRFGNLIGQML
ncbi:hypothetical protein XELAEV_18019798mg [Xenopus laevis]|uniref:Uncharacterized protein n=1 Tax=Xenopus laevis TaxID=8355 RepID=A0A974HPW4_XENLA|nr:hypothetical protein XELAEV_18019798mg [Xenopus laevis]